MRISSPSDAWQVHVPRGQQFDPSQLTDEGTLVAAWARRWRDAPHRRVVHAPGAGWITAGDLDARSRTVAGRLLAEGLQPGDRVLLSGRNSLDLIVAHIACLRAGANVVPANGAYRQREVTHLVNDCSPSFAIVDDPAWHEWILSAAPATTVTTSAVDLRDGPPAELDRAGPDDGALIGYTSGTTGAPKGAVLSHRNVLAGAASVGLAWRWSRHDRLVLCLPLFHMHGLGVGLHGTLLSGASLVLLDGFAPDAVFDAVREHDATLFFGVPTMYHRLASSARASELAPLRLCVSGSAPLPAALHERLEASAAVRVLERYGMTETVMLVSNPYEGERRAGTVGFALPGVELRIAGAEPVGDGGDAGGSDAGGSDAEPVGEVQVRGPNVFAGYWNRPDANRAAFTDDGWFRTGDLARHDGDGYLCIVGRSKELIISGGFNVYPREVEDVLAEHPAFREVAVAGRPSSEWGEQVTAFVALHSGTEAPAVADLRAWARDRLAAYKLPHELVVVDALPRNALGKVVKADLPRS